MQQSNPAAVASTAERLLTTTKAVAAAAAAAQAPCTVVALQHCSQLVRQLQEDAPNLRAHNLC
jgi:hypothetical protein